MRSNNHTRMGYTELAQLLGNPGRYAIVIFSLLSLAWIIVSSNHLIMSIIGATPDHHCKLPPGYQQSNLTIPQTSDGKLESCAVYLNYTQDTGRSIPCPNGWDYNLVDGEATVVSEWDLVCENRYLTGVSTSLYFAGGMIGGQVLGVISDKFGRKPIIVLALYLSVGFGATLYFVSNFVVFTVIRFLIGGLMQGLMMTSYVMGMEAGSTSKSRTWISVEFDTCFSLGVTIIAPVAYLLKKWRYIQLTISLFPLLTLSYIWYIPESLRWLLTQKEYVRAEKIVKDAAKFNKVKLPENFNIRPINENDNIKKSETVRKHNFCDMFRTIKLRTRSVLLFYDCMAVGISYYGISHQASNLDGNKYLNFFINGAIEIPAVLVGIWTLTRFGRRRALSGYFLLCGISCIISGAIPKYTAGGVDIQWLSTVFAWIGKFGAVGALCAVFLCAAEIFPTVIRNTGVAACGLFCRVGSVIAPQINTLGYYTHTWVSLLIFGIFALVAGLLTLILPETLHEQLPDTIEEAEDIPWPWQKSKIPEPKAIDQDTACKSDEP